MEINTNHIIGRISYLLNKADELWLEIDHYDYHPCDDYIISEFNLRTNELFLNIVLLLDHLRLHYFLEYFYLKFGRMPKDNSCHDNGYHEDGEVYNVFLMELRIFINPFIFKESECGFLYLERIIKNTPIIINASKKPPKSELEVYGPVRDLLEIIFPKSRSARSNFLKNFKAYKPDILIPELSTAIEYKFINDKEKAKNVIEQIAVDVKGYTGDVDYNNFYAVFYFTEHFQSEEKFKCAWKEAKFPKNWKYFYIVGTVGNKS